jgi:hypothetical protein
MRVNPLFAVLTFIIIIIVVLMSDSILTSIAIVILLLNFLAISGYMRQKDYASLAAVGWGEIPEDETTDATEETENDENIKDIPRRRKKSMIEENRIPAENAVEDQNTNLYGRAQEEYDGYITAYTDCWRKPKPVLLKSCGEQDHSIDAANVMMAQKRARDKRCMDGFVSKDSRFYAHHYAGELDESESKVWWGQGDW